MKIQHKFNISKFNTNSTQIQHFKVCRKLGVEFRLVLKRIETEIQHKFNISKFNTNSTQIQHIKFLHFCLRSPSCSAKTKKILNHPIVRQYTCASTKKTLKYLSPSQDTCAKSYRLSQDSPSADP